MKIGKQITDQILRNEKVSSAKWIYRFNSTALPYELDMS